MDRLAAAVTTRGTAPLVLGNEGAGTVEEGGDDQFPDGSRVMFTGPASTNIAVPRASRATLQSFRHDERVAPGMDASDRSTRAVGGIVDTRLLYRDPPVG